MKNPAFFRNAITLFRLIILVIIKTFISNKQQNNNAQKITSHLYLQNQIS